MVDASERLQVLLTQEALIYRTSDYLNRMQARTHMTEVAKDPTCDETEELSCSSQSPNKKRKARSGFEETAESSDPSNTVCESDASTVSSQINRHWREKICEWAYQVVDHFDLHREVVSIAMSHMDRYLDSYMGTVDKNLFQLLAMTCLYLAIKLNEYKHLLIPGSKSSMETILQLSRGFFTLEQMERMEYDVLQRLQWHVHPPTPQVFVKHILFLLAVEEHELHDLSQFMVELAAMDYYFVSFKASEVAVAALLNAMDMRGYDISSPHLSAQVNFLQSHFIDIDSCSIGFCRERLALIYAQANDRGSDGFSDPTQIKGSGYEACRTTSPVSVMAPPQPCQCNNQNINDSMDTEYSDDEDL